MQVRVLLLIFVSVVLAAREEARQRRPAGAPVGDKNPNSEENLKHVWGAVKGELNDPSNNKAEYHFIPIKILSAKHQVVAGRLHKYEVLVGESNCKKDLKAKELTKTNCSLREGANRALYKIELYVRSWENFTQYTVEKVRDVAATESF